MHWRVYFASKQSFKLIVLISRRLNHSIFYHDSFWEAAYIWMHSWFRLFSYSCCCVWLSLSMYVLLCVWCTGETAQKSNSMALTNPMPMGPWKVSQCSRIYQHGQNRNWISIRVFPLYVSSSPSHMIALYALPTVSVLADYSLWPGELPGKTHGVHLFLPKYNGMWLWQHPLTEGGVRSVSQKVSLYCFCTNAHSQPKTLWQHTTIIRHRHRICTDLQSVVVHLVTEGRQQYA